jgi:hypothetical protein
VTATAETLYELLPAIFRMRDEEQGGPLADLLGAIAHQAAILEESLRQLYDDQFVETCAPWVLPYIGDLLGVTGLPAEPLSSRAEVAHTIAYRRRKGTAAMLEQLARDVTGLPARADESFELLATTQYLNHVRSEAPGFLSLKDAGRLEHLGGAFERLSEERTFTHVVDVRRITSGRGRYNIPNVAIFLWRLQAFRLTRSPAVPAFTGNKRCFRFHPLGIDAPLFNRPQTEDVFTHLAEPLNVPAPITRRAMHAARSDYYAGDRSLLIERPGASRADDPVAVPLEAIVVCDLTDWTEPPAGKVAVDPVLGRLTLPADEPAPPLVTFHHGFPGPLGGGEYARVLSEGEQPVLRVAITHDDDAPFSTIQDALAALPATGGVVEIADSGRYEESLSIDATDGAVVLRAASGRRPSIVLTADLHIIGGSGDAVTLDGLLVSGGAVVVDAGSGDIGVERLRLTHCTLVPGIALNADGTSTRPQDPSLVVRASNTSVEIEHCIVGGIRAALDARMRLVGSIVDATSETNVAYADPAGTGFAAPLRAEQVTLVGRVKTDLLELGSNSLFLAAVLDTDATIWPAPVQARRRQEGCVRFSYLPPRSLTPRRYRSQPASDVDASRVRPILTSTDYGSPGYCQLSVRCAPEIQRGADDESELGAFHDLYLPQRESHLRTRLHEYLRFGLEAGVFYAT